ncbi:alpha/beta fold hydrolase [Sulfitobacter guttiformis]|uniref:Pimeloyl-ACP methyl ester carboxylesterase n=1 Tax=Sulfitobacter guttiformis TaxID=74349 RepID=A0A420DI81_9RHOB|nr:alpha/beta hydrolase [Sulfitobacter guttiformis]KIN72307.1 Hydrolase [Sulfitobacter guttiformis KCTC 32187]RKE93930.1 pimeloyl-ACP methyl ester carboxylesterase [Sulfitobacter guttiformis]
MVAFAALVLVLFVVVQWRASAREAAAARDYPPQGRVIDVDGTPVHVLIAGSGPDLVLIHGASGNVRDWTYQFTDQISDRYRVIMFDRPGLGWTGRLSGKAGPWNTTAETPLEQATLLQKAAAIVGVERPIVVGHSFGGAVAMAWALNQPSETGALVMLGAVSNPWPGDLGWTYTVLGSALGGALMVPPLAAFVPSTYVDSTVEAIFKPQPAPAGYAEHVGAGLVLRRESMRANAQQVNSLRPHIVKMSKRYAELSLPLEIVHGDADTIVPMTIHSEPLSQQVTGANLTVLEGVGHMPHHADPEAIAAAIDRAAARAGLR